MIEVFTRRVPREILIAVFQHNDRRPIFLSEIARKINATYSHVVKLSCKMVDAGLIETERKGRRKEVTLTEKGKEATIILIKVSQLLND
jgi:DNA-binding MarR family transcriptional regulator